MNIRLLPTLLVFAAAPLCAWTPETSQLIARDAVKQLPPALVGMISHYPEPFNAGFTEAKPAADRASLEAQLVAAGEQLEARMQKAGDLAGFARAWGEYLRLAIEAADPLLDARLNRAALHDYQEYFYHANGKVKKALYLDAFPASSDERGLFTLMHARADRCQRELTAVYLADGRRRSALDFDDRSNVFGLTALAFNHAVSEAAALLSRRWQRGGGDMTGSPFLPKPVARVPDPNRGAFQNRD